MSALFQILWFTLFIYVLGQRYPFFAGFIRTVSLIAVLYIVNTCDCIFVAGIAA